MTLLRTRFHSWGKLEVLVFTALVAAISTGCEEQGSCHSLVEKGTVVSAIRCSSGSTFFESAPGCANVVDCASASAEDACLARTGCAWVNLSCAQKNNLCSAADGRNLTDAAACEKREGCAFGEVCTVAMTCEGIDQEEACSSHDLCEWTRTANLH